MKENYQRLSNFKIPYNFRGRSVFFVQLWWIVQSIFFNCSPQFLYKYRVWILRLFGARIGKSCLIRPSVKITFPWKVTIGNNVWIGDDVTLYSLGEIHIGNNTVISQKTYICTATHDYKKLNFPIKSYRTIIEDEVWIGTDVYLAPNITISKGCVIGARSSVFKSLPTNMICYGYPCQPIKART